MERSATPVVKDRKILRQVDYRAARNSVLGVLSALMVYAFLSVWGELWSQYRALAVTFGFAILLLTGFRLLLVVRFDQIPGAGPGRWRRLFGGGLVLHAFAWGLLMALVVRLYGVDAAFVVVCIYNIGVVTALGNSWMGSLAARQSCVPLMFVPTIGVLLLRATPESVVLAILLGVYSVYLLRTFREQHLAFWHAMARERRPTPRKEASPGPEPAGRSVQLSLVYRLAHELRTPMNSIMGMLSLMEDTELTPEQRDYNQVAAQSGKLLLSLIDDVLDYSRILTGRITLNPDFFDLRRAIEQTLEAFGSMAERIKLELCCVMDQHLPRRVRGDRERLLQVLTNLLSNAIKFSEQGELIVRVHFDPSSERDGLLRVSVADEGPGMDATTLQNLFQDEFLHPGEDGGNPQSTGFGLLVCRGLVEAMNGEIHADSRPGEGSIFYFTAHLEMQPDMRELGELGQVMGSDRALVAGAATATEEALQEEFEALGSSCMPADNYDHALQALRESHRSRVDFQLLLVDTWSWRGSALNLCQTVLDDPALSGLGVILMVGIEERAEKVVQRLVDKHDVTVLIKPVHRHGLRNALSQLYNIETRKTLADKNPESSADRQARSHYRVMLVEDNEINQLVARGMLDKLGYQVKVVDSGEHALELLQRERFDLVLMDCMMPGLDGFEVTRRMREREDNDQRIPVIAITANTAEDVQSRCMAAGMDDFLAKPIHLDNLETLLHHWLPADTSTENEEDEE